MPRERRRRSTRGRHGRVWPVSWVAAWLALPVAALGLAALLWGTLALAARFSAGGGPERVLTALGFATALCGLLVVSHGPRFSGAVPDTARHA